MLSFKEERIILFVILSEVKDLGFLSCPSCFSCYPVK